MGFVTEMQLQELLHLQMNRPKIGEILVSMKVLTKECMEGELLEYLAYNQAQKAEAEAAAELQEPGAK